MKISQVLPHTEHPKRFEEYMFSLDENSDAKEAIGNICKFTRRSECDISELPNVRALVTNNTGEHYAFDVRFKKRLFGGYNVSLWRAYIPPGNKPRFRRLFIVKV